jgi:hypothetical protein
MRLTVSTQTRREKISLLYVSHCDSCLETDLLSVKSDRKPLSHPVVYVKALLDLR